MPKTVHYCEVCGENLYTEEFPERDAIHVRPCTWCIDRAQSNWKCLMDLFNGGNLENITRTHVVLRSGKLIQWDSLAHTIHKEWLKHLEEGSE